VLVLELALAPADAGQPDVPELDAPGVEVWRHPQGAVAAFGGARDGQYWMQVPGVGAFFFGPDSQPIVAYPEDGVGEGLLRDAFERMVLPMALQALGREVLHASGVVGPRGVLALCAVSGTGKSTLAYGLSRRGHPLWADDAVAFDLGEDSVVTGALPFALQLREPSAAHFAARGEAAPEASVSTLDSARLDAVCVVERVSEPERQGVVRLDPTDAFPAVLSHGYCFTLEDVGRKERMMSTYLELVEVVPVFWLAIGSALEGLDRTLDHLSSILERTET
jgi:hypothetical protein